MKKHTRIYFDYFGHGMDDKIPCENCGGMAVDIHHLERRGMGGSDTKDKIDNLIALCRTCHERAEGDVEFNKELKEIHLRNI